MFHVKAVVGVVILLLEKLLGVFTPGTEVIFVKDDQIPVGSMHPFIARLDASSGPIDPKKILKRTEADNRLRFIGFFKSKLSIAGNELPVFEIEMRSKVLLPCTENCRLERQYEDTLHAHFFGKLIRGKSFTETHLAVPEEFGSPPLCGYALKVGGGLIHGGLLFRTHAKIQCSAGHAPHTMPSRQHCGFNVFYVAAEPFPPYAGKSSFFKDTMNILVRKSRAIAPHCGFVKFYAVGLQAFRLFDVELLLDSIFYRASGIADLKQSLICRSRITVGINPRRKVRARGKILRHELRLYIHRFYHGLNEGYFFFI